jgi:puromycin-sensitive aminopeptidase
MGLIGNHWALVRSGGAAIESFLALAHRFGAEPDHDVLERLAGIFAFIAEQAVDAAGPGARSLFSGWLIDRFAARFETLGWRPAADESESTRLTRAALLEILGGVAEAPAICTAALAHVDAYFRDRAAVDANLVDTVVVIGARAGDAARFAQYRRATRDAATPQDRRRFLFALADFRSPASIEEAIALTRTDEIPTQDVAPFLVRALGNPKARVAVWRFVTRRWRELERRLPPMMAGRFVDALPALQTPVFKREVAAFFRTHPVPTAARALRQALERFDLNTELRERIGDGLGAWLRALPTADATVKTPARRETPGGGRG